MITNLVEKNELPSSGFLHDNSDDADFIFFQKNTPNKKRLNTDLRWTVERADSNKKIYFSKKFLTFCVFRISIF